MSFGPATYSSRVSGPMMAKRMIEVGRAWRGYCRCETRSARIVSAALCDLRLLPALRRAHERAGEQGGIDMVHQTRRPLEAHAGEALPRLRRREG